MGFASVCQTGELVVVVVLDDDVVELLDEVPDEPDVGFVRLRLPLLWLSGADPGSARLPSVSRIHGPR
jgi:hypothetical protein